MSCALVKRTTQLPDTTKIGVCGAETVPEMIKEEKKKIGCLQDQCCICGDVSRKTTMIRTVSDMAPRREIGGC